MDSAEIRSRFLRYFADRGHQVIPSASLLLDDPTLLLVNAGMVPFKPYFLGEAAGALSKRATSVQKVVRTGDIEEVGKTSAARLVLPDVPATSQLRPASPYNTPMCAVPHRGESTHR